MFRYNIGNKVTYHGKLPVVVSSVLIIIFYQNENIYIFNFFKEKESCKT